MKYLIFIFLILSSVVCGFAQTKSAIIQLNDSTTLELERSIFQKTQHTIHYADSIKYIETIDGQSVYGTDDEIPEYQLLKATLKMGSKKYDLETSSMYNPWFGDKPNSDLFKMIKINNQFHLKAIFSDGAGSYYAEWSIQNTICRRTQLCKDEQTIIGSFYYNN